MTSIEQILEDLAERRISKQEAKQLIRTVLSRKPRKIRVRVRGKTGKNVNIVVPVTMIEKALHWIPNEVSGVDIRSKIESVIEDEDFRGEVITINGDEDEEVYITIE